MKAAEAVRSEFLKKVESSRGRLVDLCCELIATPSENPSGDTSAIAAKVSAVLGEIPGMVLERIEPKPGIVNLVGRIFCGSPGRRLVLNAHLDTFPVGDASLWTVQPFGGKRDNGRIYGRGSCDMKAGLACALEAATLIAAEREHLHGELVLTLVGDEETGGKWGTSYLLENVPHAAGDAMLSGDAGSPHVLRFGEKGLVWLEVSAGGLSNHGAHVHLGRNAIDALLTALNRIATLKDMRCPLRDDILDAMKEARPVSEPISGEGEFQTLSSVTVNIGTIEGGQAMNLIPANAKAQIDIRIPPGLTTSEIIARISEMVSDLPDVSFRVLSSTEPNVTDPGHEIVQRTLVNAQAMLGDKVVRNMRVGMSDARLYRDHGVPSVVYGPSPHNMGGADEFVDEEDLYTVFHVHALTIYDYLSATNAPDANFI